jgi:hypothetical protein
VPDVFCSKTDGTRGECPGFQIPHQEGSMSRRTRRKEPLKQKSEDWRKRWQTLNEF